jgi:hypothetical protein
VDFSPTGKVLKRLYQGGVIWGIGHRARSFNGQFLTGTEHPVLYDIAKHNVFGTKPEFGTYAYRKVGVHLIPDEEIKAPLARESWLWNRPWTFDVTDRELKRDGKLTYPSDQYVYVYLSGNLNGGKIQVSATRAGGTSVLLAGDGKATIKKLGEDLWGTETLSAIRIGGDALIRGGLLHIKRSTAKTVLDQPRFRTLVKDAEKGFIAKDISHQFSCASAYDCVY